MSQAKPIHNQHDLPDDEHRSDLVDAEERQRHTVSAPRPHTPEQISALMDEASAKKDAAAKRRAPKVGIGRAFSFWLLWIGVFAGLTTAVYFGLKPASPGEPQMIIAGGMAVVIALFIAAGVTKMFSPVLMTGAMLRRAGGKSASEAAELAGAEILSALGLAERVLDADQDARLVSRRDGVVTYANSAYFELAQMAGVMGPAGLPPRIDRLFAQQGAEATKVFRLCRAAKSAEPAEEIIYQVMGMEGGGKRRRFEVSVRPIKESEDHVAWRLRELPVDEEEHDALAAAYADFPRSVFALERSGQIAWSNAAMRNDLGVDRGVLQDITDVVLGETAEIVRQLWQVDRATIQALVRRNNADPIDAEFVAFRRGGVGEGFVCVELAIDDPVDEDEPVSLSGDISESPFGIAIN